MNRRAIGTGYEQLACDYLQGLGYQILEKNFRIRTGEIDIIARDGAYLVFTEVKFRSGLRKGSPLEAVTIKKQKTIIQTARYYLMSRGYGQETACRFDVIGITDGKLEHIRDAFFS